MTKFSKGFQCALYVFLLSYALSGAIAAISDAPIGLPIAICGSIAAFFGLIAPFKAGKYSIFIALAFFAGFCLWRYDTTVELVRAIVAWFSGDAYIVDIMRLDLVLYICPMERVDEVF